MLNVDRARVAAQSLVERATAAGADAADALYVGERSSSVQVRLGELEQVNRSEGEEIGLRLFLGRRSATVASSDLADEALAALVERALAMAAAAPEDEFAGLAPDELLHRGDCPSLDSDDGRDPDPASLRALALAAEQSARAVPGVTNSNGGSASASASTVALATSAGFAGAYRATGYSCSAGVVAGTGAGMQRDHAWHSARHLEDLDEAEAIGRLAGTRAVARLNPTRPKPGRMAVLFDPRVASTLLGHFAGAISGSAVARKSSFLQDRLGSAVFGAGVTIVDDPLRRRGLRSRPFDGEGLRVERTELVSGGVLTGWIAESASARQLGIRPTGHAARGAGGAPGASPSNLYMAAGPRSRDELLAAFPEAILVTELIGQGVNSVTGDYSRGAAGFLVRDGAIAGPVAEITIASNLLDMFATLEPGSDLELRRGIDAPTLLVPEMTVGAA
ncbi:MAG TPA: metallopeptidase TldD-related protein [Sphingomicrobium sp.]|nr:metallopeptidase TldD-related protein [Sphingomicrobium sp.]